MADRLGDARRANGARIESERRAIGQRMESERRANGRRIESERTGAAVQDDINCLVRPVVVRKQLATVPPVGALPLKRGRADYKAPAATATGGGIASPLTEVEVDRAGDRTYWPAMLQETTDGLFSFEVRPIKTWKFLDADGNAVVLNIAKPATVA
jgi:hypothetical protein